MNVNQKRQKNITSVLLLSILIFVTICIFGTCYSIEINKLFADRNLTLKTRVNFALELAIKKFDGKKIWLIYSIDSCSTIIHVGMPQETIANDNLTLNQVILGETEGTNNKLIKQDISDQSTALFVKKLKQNTPDDRIQAQTTTTKNKTTHKLAVILDYSLESGHPCLHQIYLQRMGGPFLKQTRPIFWLEEAASLISVDWLMNQFYQTKYKKLKQQIISTIGVHNCTNKVIEFQKRIILGDYPSSLKNEAIYWLGRHNSFENIQLLTHLAVNNKDTRIRKKAIFSLSQIKDKRAQAVIFALSKKDKDTQVRQEAIFWLGQLADEDAIEVLNEILTSENDPSIKEYTIFAISQLPEKKATPILSQIVQTNPDFRIRKKAMFWLGRTRDQKMMDFFLELVDKSDRQGSN